MYGTPHDPTFNKALIRELRQQGKRCSGCRYNNTKPGDKHCTRGHWAWPTGPCILHEDIDHEDFGT